MARYRVIAPDRCSEFLRKGYRKRHFFPHTLRFLPKVGPGAVRLAEAMCGISDLGAHWEIVLHALAPSTIGFPRELFFDDDIIWHRQHYGQESHVAFAFVVVEGDRMFGLNYVSDVVQRISRRRDLKTRVETVFHGWVHMLLHGLLNFAIERGVRTFFSPTADLVLRNSRPAGRALFERIYDCLPPALFDAERVGHWWTIDVPRQLDRIVRAEAREEHAPARRTVAVTYDAWALPEAERGRELATYLVPPSSLFHDLQVRSDGRSCLAFTAADALSRPQLSAELCHCRTVDSRARGYRLPFARPPAPGEVRALCYRKFDWLLVRGEGPDAATPAFRRGIVTIPVSCDDRDLHPAHLDAWATRLLGRLDQEATLVLALGANWWRGDRRRRSGILETIASTAELRTCDELADALILSRAL